MNSECHICSNLGIRQCGTCNAICCDTHYGTIHKGICKIGKTEKISRLE